MTVRRGARVAVTLGAIVILGGSLAGCGRGIVGGELAPAVGAPAGTTTPVPTGGSDGSSLSSIQGDLDSANSATDNAGGDVTDADNSAATSDSP